jgi:glutathione peroxidase-family protein
MFEKCEVNGPKAHPLWVWMKSQKNGKGTLSNDIKTSWTKFLIDQQGQVVCREAASTAASTYEQKIKDLFENSK